MFIRGGFIKKAYGLVSSFKGNCKVQNNFLSPDTKFFTSSSEEPIIFGPVQGIRRFGPNLNQGAIFFLPEDEI